MPSVRLVGIVQAYRTHVNDCDALADQNGIGDVVTIEQSQIEVIGWIVRQGEINALRAAQGKVIGVELLIVAIACPFNLDAFPKFEFPEAALGGRQIVVGFLLEQEKFIPGTLTPPPVNRMDTALLVSSNSSTLSVESAAAIRNDPVSG